LLLCLWLGLCAREIKLGQVLQLVLDESWPTKAIGFEVGDGPIPNFDRARGDGPAAAPQG
jgi:hypothetical protein